MIRQATRDELNASLNQMLAYRGELLREAKNTPCKVSRDGRIAEANRTLRQIDRLWDLLDTMDDADDDFHAVM